MNIFTHFIHAFQFAARYASELQDFLKDSYQECLIQILGPRLSKRSLCSFGTVFLTFGWPVTGCFCFAFVIRPAHTRVTIRLDMFVFIQRTQSGSERFLGHLGTNRQQSTLEAASSTPSKSPKRCQSCWIIASTLVFSKHEPR